MGDTMLHGVLRMPPHIWCDSELDKAQRHSRYLEASERIIRQDDRIAELEAEVERLRADAARLDWLDTVDCGIEHVKWGDYRTYSGPNFRPIRQVIDEAMKGGA